MNPHPHPSIRKHQLGEAAAAPPDAPAVDEIDVVAAATLGYTSECAEHPVEHLFDRHDGPGGTRWVSERVNTAEQLVVAFESPRPIERVRYEVEERERERTQEVHLEISDDGGRSFRRLRVQPYTFSPQGATFQREDLRIDAPRVTHLRITVVPNIGGDGAATMTSLRLFGPASDARVPAPSAG